MSREMVLQPKMLIHIPLKKLEAAELREVPIKSMDQLPSPLTKLLTKLLSNKDQFQLLSRPQIGRTINPNLMITSSQIHNAQEISTTLFWLLVSLLKLSLLRIHGLLNGE